MDHQEEGWYESLFNWSPWLVTLRSALAGLLILLLLPLTCDPCIINALVIFVKEQTLHGSTDCSKTITQAWKLRRKASQGYEMMYYSRGEWEGNHNRFLRAVARDQALVSVTEVTGAEQAVLRKVTSQGHPISRQPQPPASWKKLSLPCCWKIPNH